jgi:ParB family chromosome partitioning protein
VSLSYKRLLEECQLKQEELGDRVGKDRSTVSNYLRLLRLPDEVQIGLKINKISMGHAKAILSVEDPDEQIALYRRIEKENLSVRGAEEVVKQAKAAKGGAGSSGKTPSAPSFEIDDALKMKIDKINTLLSSQMMVKPKGNKGEIVIPFKNYEELERILTNLAEHE